MAQNQLKCSRAKSKQTMFTREIGAAGKQQRFSLNTRKENFATAFVCVGFKF